MFKDSEGKTEIQKEDTVIVATGHVWDDGKITTPATCTEVGIKTFICKNDSDHTRTETVPATGHKLTKTDAKVASCEDAGNIEYWTCSFCKKLFKDSEGKTEISQADTVIAAIGHDWDDGKITIPATCTEDGVKTFICQNDSDHTRTETIPAIGHKLTKTEAKVASYEEDGNIEYWTCTECHLVFKDATGETEITQADTVVKATVPMENIEAERTDDSITVNLINPQSGDILIVSIFNSFGRFLGIQQVTLTGDENSHTFDFAGKDFRNAKVMLLDQNWHPVCEKVEV